MPGLRVDLARILDLPDTASWDEVIAAIRQLKTELFPDAEHELMHHLYEKLKADDKLSIDAAMRQVEREHPTVALRYARERRAQVRT